MWVPRCEPHDSLTMSLIFSRCLQLCSYDAVHSDARVRLLDVQPVKKTRGFRSQAAPTATQSVPPPDSPDSPGTTPPPGSPTPGTSQQSQSQSQSNLSPSDQQKLKWWDDLVRKGMKLAGFATPDYRVSKGDKHCTVCDRDFDSTARLKSHVKKVHWGLGKYICQEPDCDKRFQTRQALEAHTGNIHGDKGKKCPTCQKVFGTSRALKLHKKLHDDPAKEYRCDFCNKPFTVERYYKEHTPSCYRNPNRFTVACPHCGREFHQRKTLNKHIKEDH